MGKLPRRVLMIAGPNGAGKTTMTLELLRNCPMLYEYINADEIARGLAPKNPETVALEASKLMIGRLKELLEAGQSFAFETTAAGTNYVKHLEFAKSKEYKINMTFLWLSSPKEAAERVAQRVKQGGHYDPNEVIARRYYLGIKNLILHYLPLADEALVIDNSLEEKASKRLILRKSMNDSVDVIDKQVWGRMQEMARGR